jgi:hypothetical protein
MKANWKSRFKSMFSDFPRDLCGFSLRPLQLKVFEGSKAELTAKLAKKSDRSSLRTLRPFSAHSALKAF